MVKVITGVRRCGKSVLLFELLFRHLITEGVSEKNIIKISLDSDDFAKLRSPLNLSRYIKERINDSEYFYIFIDEIQFVKKNMLYGGMPAVVSRPSPETKISYLQNLFEETFLKDIVERNRIRDSHLLLAITNELCSATGSLTNPLNLANSINSSTKRTRETQVNSNTVTSYLQHLEDAFIIKEAKRYDIRGKKYFSSSSKFYCVDVGLRNVRLNMRQNEETHIMENVVFNSLIQRDYNVDVGVLESFKKVDGKSTRINREIDFVVNKGNVQCYVQSAFSMNTPEKQESELAPFNIVGNSFRKIVVTRNEIAPWYDDMGIYHIGLADFLLAGNELFS